MSSKSIADFFQRKPSNSNREIISSEPVAKKAKIGSTEPEIISNHNKFLCKWMKEFPWVIYNKDENKMYCKMCQNANMKTAMAMTGSSCFQRSTLTRHEKIPEHRISLNNKKEATIMKNIIENANSTATEGDLSVFKTVYTIGKEELPLSKYKPLMMLMKSCGNETINESHLNLSKTSIADITKAISDVLEFNLDGDVSQSPFISLMIDESTDISTEHKLIIYVKYLKNNESQSSLWANLKLSGECNADALKEILLKFLNEKNVQLPKIVALSTDGAAVMMGKNNGLGKKLQDMVPGLLHYHCIAHRLALAVSQAANGIIQFQNFQRILGSVYAYFHMSNIRTEKLKLMQDVLNERNITLKDVNAVRWLSLGNAVEACHISYDAVILALTDIVASKNASSHIIDKGPGLLKHCSEFTFGATLSFLRDVLLNINKVSKIFQANDVDFSVVVNELESTINRMKEMKQEKGHGTHLKEFLESANKHGYYRDIKVHTRTNSLKDFMSAKDTFLNALIKNLQHRFNLQQMYLLQDFDILLNPSCVTSTESSRLQSLNNVIKHYYSSDSGSVLGVSPEELRQELLNVESLYTRYKEVKFQQFCKLIFASSLDGVPIYPGFTSLAQIAMIIPLSTAVCERGFSTQNRIKTDKRNRLTGKQLEILSRISEQGPDFQEKNGNVVCDFNFNDAVKSWKMQKKKRRLQF